MISIKRWTDGSVIHSGDFASVKECLEDGVKKGIYFDYAELNGAELNRAELKCAELNHAELKCAELNRAELNGAELNGAELNGAKLNRAELNGAELNYAELSGAGLYCAKLNRAQLNYAELSDAWLWSTIGNDKQIKNINNLRWTIAYTKDTMQIGCERHLISEWASFTDEEIDRMDVNALEFWKEHKQMIFNTIEESPAEE